ncbi:MULTISPECIES: Crp/Fnr family transcriptional regulator [Aphanothece]|uniref:Crp/Fnr family transcriptional regulator n=1 Tax=Aphanothece TaxID=1121 RepID=UPI00398542A0
MSRRCLRLSLRAGETLPANIGWRLEQGYLWLARWTAGADPLTLGVWGPGELVIPSLVGLSDLELRSLSPVVVVEEEPSSAMEQEFLQDQLRQSAMLLLLSRVRPAESRLLQLLDWFGTRFGTMTGQGVQLRFGERPLTHQQLADIAGMTRVTVTKALSQFRQAGLITGQQDGALLLRRPVADLWECH